MKLYTVFTESHHQMFKDYFIKSFPFESNLELIVKFKPQVCKTSEFHSDGWRETMMYKVQCFIDAAYETKDGEYFIFSDPDIQFFKPFYNDLLSQVQGFDAAFQNDYIGGVNTGFFIMKSTPNTRAFLQTVKGNLHLFPEEQVCFNHLIGLFSQHSKIAFNAKFLSREYWTYGEIALQRPRDGQPMSHWNGIEDFDIPKNIIMHHGNWVKTFKDKTKIMDVVKEKVKNL